MKSTKTHVKPISKKVLAACSNKKLFKKLGNYFIKNKDIAVECITILDTIKEKIQSKLKINLQQDVCDSTAPFFDIDKYENKVKSEKKCTSVVQMLSECTQTGYGKVYSEMLNEVGISNNSVFLCFDTE